MTGQAEEARRSSGEALARARELDNPFTLAGAPSHASILALMLRDTATAERLASESFALAAEHGLELWRSVAGIVRACATLGDGRDVGRAVKRARTAIGAWERTDSRIFLATAHGFLAGALRDAGRLRDGIAVVDRGILLAEITLDRMYEAELWPIKGELLLRSRGDENAASTCFDRALLIARRQGAVALEQRAVESQTRLAGGGRRAASATRGPRASKTNRLAVARGFRALATRDYRTCPESGATISPDSLMRLEFSIARANGSLIMTTRR